MSNVIRFLETLGREVGAGAAQSPEFTAAAAGLDLDPPVRDALLAGDTAALARLLGGRPNLMILLVPSEPGDEKPDDDGGEAPESRLRDVA